MTPIQELQERNARCNGFRREARSIGIVSPYRQGVYIGSRLNGKSIDEALAEARKEPSTLRAKDVTALLWSVICMTWVIASAIATPFIGRWLAKGGQ